LSHLEQRAPIPQHVPKDAVERRAPRQQTAQHRAVRQHQAAQHVKVVLPGCVADVDAAARQSARRGVQLSKRVLAAAQGTAFTRVRPGDQLQGIYTRLLGYPFPVRWSPSKPPTPFCGAPSPAPLRAPLEHVPVCLYLWNMSQSGCTSADMKMELYAHAATCGVLDEGSRG
jgi:hypothetical protein